MSTKDLMALVKSKKANMEAASGRREKTHKPQVGQNRYRILPGWRKDGDVTFYHDFGQHFIKDKKGDLKAVYICSDRVYGKPCELCDAIGSAVSDTTDDDLIKTLVEAKSKGRVLMNALHLNGEDPTAPIPLDLTPTTFEKVLDIIAEYGVDFLDLKVGTDIVINRSGKGLNTEYNVMAAAKSQPVSPSVMAKLIDLDAYVKQEYEQGKVKALAALASVSGNPALAGSAAFGGPGATKAIAGPSPKTIEGTATTVDDDEIPFEGAGTAGVDLDLTPTAPAAPTKAEAAAALAAATATSEVAPAPAGDAFNDAISDSDIEALINDM